MNVFMNNFNNDLIEKTSHFSAYSLMNKSVMSEDLAQIEPNSSNETGLHCSRGALTGFLGLFVQAVLAFLAFTSLIGKVF